MAGVNKTDNRLIKDLENEASFEDSPRFQAFLAKIDKLIPPGVIVPWLGGYFTATNNVGFTSQNSYNLSDLKSTKKFNEFYVIADGSICDNNQSLYFGQIIPNITDDRFLCGAVGPADVGVMGGSNTILDHIHILDSSDLATFNINYSTSLSDMRGSVHTHGAYSISYTSYAYLGRHSLAMYNDGGGSNTLPAYPLLTDDDPDRIIRTKYAGNHSHTKYGLSYSYTFSVPSHDHPYSISGVSIGSGVGAINTDNRPKYLSCIYLFKVI